MADIADMFPQLTAGWEWRWLADQNLREGPCVPAKTYGSSPTAARFNGSWVVMTVWPDERPDFPVLMRGSIVGMFDRWHLRTGKKRALLDALLWRYIRMFRITAIDHREVDEVVSGVERHYREKFGYSTKVPHVADGCHRYVLVNGQRFWRDSLDWRQLGALERAQSFMRRTDIEMARAQRGLAAAAKHSSAEQRAAQ